MSGRTPTTRTRNAQIHEHPAAIATKSTHRHPARVSNAQKIGRCCMTNTNRTNRRASQDNRKDSNPVTKASAASHKLEELKLAFGLLAQQIQGTDEDEKRHSLGVCPPPKKTSTSDTCREATAEGQQDEVAEGSRAIASSPTDLAQRTSPPNDAHPASQYIYSEIAATPDATSARECDKVTRSSALPLARKTSDPSNAAAEGIHGGPRPRDADGRTRAKVITHAESQNLDETVARRTHQELRRLRAELGEERRSRIAAESALQELQLRAAESNLVREKLARIVSSFGGRSLEELSAAAQGLEKRVRDAESALTDSQRFADGKVAEALEAFEEAERLMKAFEAEKTARKKAEDDKKCLTQNLRACLRGRARAEEEASLAAASLKKSEAQKESLAQRLEVLRATNKRLDRRAAVTTSAEAAEAAAPSGEAGVGDGGDVTEGNTGVRLALARARIRTLAWCNSNSTPKGRDGTANGTDFAGRTARDERASAERARKAIIMDKRWKERLRGAEAQGQAYKSAAHNAEAAMRRAVKDRTEMEELNSVLAAKLTAEEAHHPSSCERNVVKRDASDEISASHFLTSGDGGAQLATVAVQNPAAIVRRSTHASDVQPKTRERGSSSSSSSSNNENTAGKGKTDSPIQLVRPGSVKMPSIMRGSRVLLEPAEAVAEVAAALLAHSNESNVDPCHGHSFNAADSIGATASGSGSRPGTNQQGLEVKRISPQPTTKTLQRGQPTSVTVLVSDSPSDHRRSHVRPCSAGEDGSSGDRNVPSKGIHGLQSGAANEDNSAVLYSRLLSESRMLREEFLSAVRNGPWRGGPKFDGWTSDRASTTPAAQEWPAASSPVKYSAMVSPLTMVGATATTKKAVLEGVGDSGVELRPETRRVTTVPIDVLLRLYSRRSRNLGAKPDAGATEKVMGEAAADVDRCTSTDLEGASARPDMKAELHESAQWGGGHARHAHSKQETASAIIDRVLPPGISDALAQQVEGAVSKGDERSFLQIVGRCGSTTREGIARLLLIDTPD